MLATKEQAHRIALDLREAGRGPGQEGKFKAVQGIGWWLDEANMAQISVNITDIEVTALHQVYEEVYYSINCKLKILNLYLLAC